MPDLKPEKKKHDMKKLQLLANVQKFNNYRTDHTPSLNETGGPKAKDMSDDDEFESAPSSPLKKLRQLTLP